MIRRVIYVQWDRQSYRKYRAPSRERRCRMVRPRSLQKASHVLAIVSTNTEVSNAMSTTRNETDACFLRFGMYGLYVEQGVILRQRDVQ